MNRLLLFVFGVRIYCTLYGLFVAHFVPGLCLVMHAAAGFQLILSPYNLAVLLREFCCSHLNKQTKVKIEWRVGWGRAEQVEFLSRRLTQVEIKIPYYS
uniref:Uncharacterized protein n=1 Tax=Arundo donax TaxID=35708 RepID=A0A0A9D103_ARUDO